MRQLARREPEPTFLEGLLRRLRELTIGDVPPGELRSNLDAIIDESERDQGSVALSGEERVLVRNALGFGTLRVDDVMVPRGDISGIEAASPLAEVVRVLGQGGHSRLVVYRTTLDDVLGVVHIKDLLPFWGDGAAFALEKIIRPVLVVPPSMRVVELLAEMRSTRNHVALVVDEFGGIDGLVTMGDLVSEMMGEMRDEHDRDEPVELVAHPDGTFEAAGRTDLEELEERLGVPMLGEDERDEADTLGGLILALADRVPARGEIVRHPSGYLFEVLDADPRRIKRVRITPPAPGSERRDDGEAES